MSGQAEGQGLSLREQAGPGSGDGPGASALPGGPSVPAVSGPTTAAGEGLVSAGDSSTDASSSRTLIVRAALEEQKVSGPMVAVIRPGTGEQRQILVDNGTRAYDRPRDGVWTASFKVPALRFVELKLLEVKGTQQTVLYQRLMHLPDTDPVEVSFFVEEREGGLQVMRTAWLDPRGGDGVSSNQLYLTLAFGWGLLCLLFVAWLVRASRREAV